MFEILRIDPVEAHRPGKVKDANSKAWIYNS
jgi:hypothetical protein